MTNSTNTNNEKSQIVYTDETPEYLTNDKFTDFEDDENISPFI